MVNLKTEAGVRTFEAIAADVADLVLEFGGALSGEHGDGLVRSPFMEKMFGPVLYDAFRQIKRTFDPDGIFNPGKIVDAPPLTANLRYGARLSRRRSPPRSSTTPSTAAWAARSRCAAASARAARRSTARCARRTWRRARKTHSTRGRANVLRLAMAGRLGETGLGDEGVKRGDGPLPGVPRVQGGVPGRRRRRAVQERVPGRLLAAARHAAPRARARPRPRAGPLGQPPRAGLELDRAERARPRG